MQANKISYAPILHEAHVIPLTHYYFQSFRSHRFVLLLSSLVRLEAAPRLNQTCVSCVPKAHAPLVLSWARVCSDNEFALVLGNGVTRWDM